MARAREGDEAAFRALVERYQDRAFGLALRIVQSAEVAEDVAQEAFVRAWRGLPAFRGDARFSTWLYRIVARRSFDAAATLKALRERETGIEAADDVAAGGVRDDRAERAALRERLERLIARLPEEQRASITLFYYQDRSVDEVARILGLPPGTVKTHLHRARAALRSAWVRQAARGGLR